MTTLKEAREALDYLQGRIDAGSMAGERLTVIAQYINSQYIIKKMYEPWAMVDEATVTFDPLGTLPTFEELRGFHDDLMKRGLTPVFSSATVPMSGDMIEMKPDDMAKLRASIRAYDGAPKPYNTTTDLTTNACANCIEQGIIQPGCQHD